MGLINYSNISDGTSIDANDVNNPFNTVYNEFNGNIEAANIKNGSITQEKLANYADVSWSNVPAANTVSSVTANGNRSYDITFGSSVASFLSPGMRIRTTRTVAAPTQCTDLEAGSSQYFSKTSPTGLAFTTTFTCSAWIKLESYHNGGIIARRNADTEGWNFSVESTGQIILVGLRIASNNKVIRSYQSLPLNKWVHVAATLDMAAGDTTAQKIWIDGVEVPRAYVLTGAASALVQGTTALTVGAEKSSGTFPFDGKIAQAAVFSTQLSDATVKAMMNQTMTGSETSLVSAYSFNNSINDLNTTNANNLTAQGSAVATNADSCFGYQADGTISSTLDYGIVTKISTTVATVQVPEGCTIPTTGGVATVSYATVKTPYGFPGQQGKWVIESIYRSDITATVTTNYIWVAHTANITIPTGSWQYGLRGTFAAQTTGASSSRSSWVTLASATPTGTVVGTIDGGNDYPIVRILNAATGTTSAHTYSSSERDIDLSASTTFTSYGCSDSITATETVVLRALQGAVRLFARNAYL